MSMEYLRYLPSIVGLLVAVYWATKISIQGTFSYISTPALRSMWIGLGLALLWFVYLNYPISAWYLREPSYFRTWFIIILGLIFCLLGVFSNRKGLVLFTSGIYSPVNESDLDSKELENEPDRNNELPY